MDSDGKLWLTALYLGVPRRGEQTRDGEVRKSGLLVTYFCLIPPAATCGFFVRL